MGPIYKYIFIAFACFITSPLFGVSLSKNEKLNLSSLNARTEYYRISNNGATITGLSLSGGLTYALRKKK